MIGLLGAPGGATSGTPGTECPSIEPETATGSRGDSVLGMRGATGITGLSIAGSASGVARGLGGALIPPDAVDEMFGRPVGGGSGSLLMDWA